VPERGRRINFMQHHGVWRMLARYEEHYCVDNNRPDVWAHMLHWLNAV